MPNVSARGLALPPSPIRKLAPYAEAARARGVKVFHLNIGQPDLETPKVMRDRLKSLDPVIAYSPSAGTPQYLSALSGYYASLGLKIEATNLVATTGGSEAVLFAFLCLAEVGDEVIVAEPFYTNYSSFAAMTGVTLVPVQCRGEEGFHLPAIEAFEAVLTRRTRFVLLCNPNNPTGTVYSREETQRVADFCRDHDLFLVSDEVYREFVYDGLVATSALDLEGCEDRVVVVDSLSKRFSACGIRLGCFVSRNSDVIAAVTRAAQGRLSPPGLAQVLALGMSEIGPDYYASVRAEYQKRRDVIFEELSRLKDVFLQKPEGAFYVVARLPVKDSDDFARFLLEGFSFEGETVMVAPAAGFYSTPGLGGNEVRLAYVLNCEDLRRSIRILGEGLTAYLKREA
ncbi:MAG: pyridoxal phosphate-dependent aminotransferase [Vicinamibacteria bacterium]|nr:pyridoxal phosphate-dependent aminotransferase [Vicinamibacteria bacterium]